MVASVTANVFDKVVSFPTNNVEFNVVALVTANVEFNVVAPVTFNLPGISTVSCEVPNIIWLLDVIIAP